MNPLDLIKNITPLKVEVSSGWATFWALVFGGLGLGIFIRVQTKEWSGADFLLPIIFAVICGVVLKGGGVLLGAILAGLYAYLRIEASNKAIQEARAAEAKRLRENPT